MAIDAAAVDALIAEYGPLRVALLADLLRHLPPGRTAAAVARLAASRLDPVDAALVTAVAAAIGVPLAC